MTFCEYKKEPNIIPDVKATEAVLYVTFFTTDVPRTVFLSIVIINYHLSVGAISHDPSVPTAGVGVANIK